MANSLLDAEIEIEIKNETEDGVPQNREIESILYQFSSSGKSVIQNIVYDTGAPNIRWQPIAHDLKFDDPHSAFWFSYLRSRESLVTDPKAKSVNVADLYSGIGGLSLGIREACISLGLGFNSRLAIENDPLTLRVYNDNFDCDIPIQSDITKLLNGKLGGCPTTKENKFINKVGKIDFVVAGPPCQGFSNLNNHTRRDDERNNLYMKAARFVKLFTPENIIIENVSQVKLDKNGFIEKTISVLDKLDYSHDEAVIDLSLLGAPQKRKRHVIVASRRKEIDISKILMKYRIDTPQDAMWAIDDLQDTDNGSLMDEPANLSITNQERIHYLHLNNLYKLPFEYRPKCHQNYDHSYWSMYGRIYPDRPAQTITGGFYSPGQGRYIHPTRERTITAHEAARLQFFPDFYNFSKITTKKAIAKMIGNAAPMLLSYYLALDLLC